MTLTCYSATWITQWFEQCLLLWCLFFNFQSFAWNWIPRWWCCRTSKMNWIAILVRSWNVKWATKFKIKNMHATILHDNINHQRKYVSTCPRPISSCKQLPQPFNCWLIPSLFMPSNVHNHNPSCLLSELYSYNNNDSRNFVLKWP